MLRILNAGTRNIKHQFRPYKNCWAVHQKIMRPFNELGRGQWSLVSTRAAIININQLTSQSSSSSAIGASCQSDIKLSQDFLKLNLSICNASIRWDQYDCVAWYQSLPTRKILALMGRTLLRWGRNQRTGNVLSLRIGHALYLMY
jgi:hypothetical protein